MRSTEYSRRIKKLRAALQLTQHALADRVHVRPQVVASWEQGRKEPSAASYRRLADLAPPRDAWFFLKQMGVTKQLVRAKWPGRTSRHPSKEAAPRPMTMRIRFAGVNEAHFVQIPLLRENLSATPRAITEDDIESVMAVPISFIPNKSGAYVGIRQRGGSMAPVLQDRFIVVVDQTNRDPARLTGRMVAIWAEGGPLVRWLGPGSDPRQWVLRPENPNHPALSLDAAATERILGDVVYWWGSQS
ncbi:MAG: helix-turn-helix domain-containing protein [Acidobacteria bacterium]|nr:helix-turn-helix domain-containing protein [Acidobacteriota bacterium]